MHASLATLQLNRFIWGMAKNKNTAFGLADLALSSKRHQNCSLLSQSFLYFVRHTQNLLHSVFWFPIHSSEIGTSAIASTSSHRVVHLPKMGEPQHETTGPNCVCVCVGAVLEVHIIYVKDATVWSIGGHQSCFRLDWLKPHGVRVELWSWKGSFDRAPMLEIPSPPGPLSCSQVRWELRHASEHV